MTGQLLDQPTTVRCFSCGHEAALWHRDGGCHHATIIGRTGADLVCPCALNEAAASAAAGEAGTPVCLEAELLIGELMRAADKWRDSRRDRATAKALTAAVDAWRAWRGREDPVTRPPDPQL